MPKCTRCGQCCISLTENGHFSLPISRQDARKISKLAKFNEYKASGKIAIVKSNFDVLYDLELSAEGLCPFLDMATKSCEIYNLMRPESCIKFQCYK